MADRFRTLEGPATGEFRAKGSRHLGFVFPVSTAEEAILHVETLRRAHVGAVHTCFAYRLGADGAVWRASDDGEPAHSAGTPILGVLRSRELTHVVAAVVRYFGGTKLGIPGLIEAYREATVAALAGASIVERDVLVCCTIEFPFYRIGEVMRLVKQWNGTPGAPDFTGSTARLEVYLPQSQHAGAAASLAPLAAFGVRASFQQAPL